jgi:hypothetical protein
LDNVAVASVFLELDASAVLQLTLQAKAGENVTIDKNQTASASSNAPVTEATSSGPANATHVAASHAIRRNSHAMFAARTATTNTSASFGGCVDVSAGLDVNAGADASFFGLFDAQTKVNLFTKKFDLFKVGSSPSQIDMTLTVFTRNALDPALEARDLTHVEPPWGGVQACWALLVQTQVLVVWLLWLICH